MEWKKYFRKILEQKGNTLIQLPVTVALISTLALGTVSAFDSAEVLEQARDARRSADAYQVTLALNMYALDHGTFPVYTGDDSAQSWETLHNTLEGSYIHPLPIDPNEDAVYSYRYWSDGQRAIITYFSEVQEKYFERWAF